MPRKQKILTEYDVLCRNKTGSRLEALKNERGMTIVSLAKALHISDSALRNYIKGRKELDPDVAKNLETLYGKITPFWMGQTDSETWISYYGEMSQLESDALSEYEAATQAEQKKLIDFFSVCGYRYQNLSGIAEFDFADLDSHSEYQGVAGPHKLTNINYPSTPPAYFSQDELDTLLKQLHDTVGFACYKKNVGK